MQLIHDYYIVSVDQRYEVKKGSLTAVNSAIFRDSVDTPEHKRDDAHYRHKRLWGTILTCPSSFTAEMVELVDPGRPPYGGYIGHDYISLKIREGYRGRAVPKYRCSAFDKYDKITRADYARMVDVKEGDKVYFSYLVTEPENLLGEDRFGNDIYKLLVTDVFCSIREERHPITGKKKKKIIMQGDWMLTVPVMESWEEITTPTGILMKPRPDAKYLEAIIRHVRHHPDLKTGQHVFYEPVSNAPITIEGEDFFLMKHSDILCFV